MVFFFLVFFGGFFFWHFLLFFFLSCVWEKINFFPCLPPGIILSSMRKVSGVGRFGRIGRPFQVRGEDHRAKRQRPINILWRIAWRQPAMLNNLSNPLS